MRVRVCGYDIPEAAIRRRFELSRLNLTALLPKLTALRVYDISVEADPARGKAPAPTLVLRVLGKILYIQDVTHAPDWAKPIDAAAWRKLARGR